MESGEIPAIESNLNTKQLADSLCTFWSKQIWDFTAAGKQCIESLQDCWTERDYAISAIILCFCLVDTDTQLCRTEEHWTFTNEKRLLPTQPTNCSKETSAFIKRMTHTYILLSWVSALMSAIVPLSFGTKSICLAGNRVVITVIILILIEAELVYQFTKVNGVAPSVKIQSWTQAFSFVKHTSGVHFKCVCLCITIYV